MYEVLVVQSYPTLCDPMDLLAHQTSLSMGFCRQDYWSGILQARLLEWVAIPFSRGSFQPRDQIWVYMKYITSVFGISSFLPFSIPSVYFNLVPTVEINTYK